MGLLNFGTPLKWHESIQHQSKINKGGIEQFLHIYNAAKDFKDHELKWGDEVEYLIMQTDHSAQKTTLLLDAPELLEQLQEDEHAQPEGSSVPALWRPEYARWMIEGTPGVPYRCFAADLVTVERNMALRRKEIQKLLRVNQSVLTIPSYPRIGCGYFTTPPVLPFGEAAQSVFTGDMVMSPHPRFVAMTWNTRLRRGQKADIRMPLFMDEKTPESRPLVPIETAELLREARRISEGREGLNLDIVDSALKERVGKEIVMDSLAFGIGMNCLQVTLQGRDLIETRYLYDQLAVMAPIMLAVTAGTPILRGLLADTDARWDVISGAMDDRTHDEIESGSIPKSRYSSIDAFLSCREKFKPGSYNDLPIPIDEEAYNRLREGGVDHLLAQHIAHLFIRNSIVMYEELLDLDNSKSSNHFENIQSTNWNTVRLKPPPLDTDIGWRTEFRSMEVGLTDFENAAFSVFIVILSRVILAFNLNFYIPISKVDENMDTAHKRDAVRREMFHFRKNIFKKRDGIDFLRDCGTIYYAPLVGSSSQEDTSSSDGLSSDSDSEPFESMTLNEIFNGKPLWHDGRQAGFAFPGLIPLMRGYVEGLTIDPETRARLFLYLEFVSERASGSLCTNATYMRNFVRNHPSYRGDSEVSEEINYDLIQNLQGITNGTVKAPELLGKYQEEAFHEDIETPDAMIERMQKKMVGLEAGQLPGASMPDYVLHNTIRSLARLARNDAIDIRCFA